ncbi:hypothetical protein T11_5739 [Trichinella zimbabwensis]|uniref:Uncharacterized protein n=1 Tax=Trichinella zimbabwensis TaxID=268475 RepID=A0A0V1I8F9_9BILA|nr:hypothetical protein T11_5739 [Trichinella zimbabwensis]
MSQLTETQTLLHDIPESRKSSVDSRRPSRRISRAYEIRPSYRSEKPLYDWLCEHLDKQTVNLNSKGGVSLLPNTITVNALLLANALQ